MKIDELKKARNEIWEMNRLQIGNCKLLSKKITLSIWIVLIAFLLPVSAWVAVSLADIWDKLPFYGRTVPFIYWSTLVFFVLQLARNNRSHDEAVHRWELKRAQKLNENAL
jgi:hypothetical protein